MCVLLFCEHKRKDWFAPYASGTELQPKSVSRAVSRGVVWRERVGTAFPHLFHVLLQNESEAVLKRLFFGCVPKPFLLALHPCQYPFEFVHVNAHRNNNATCSNSFADLHSLPRPDLGMWRPQTSFGGHLGHHYCKQTFIMLSFCCL